MKRTGLGILVFGLLITLITGFTFITKEKIVDIGTLEISGKKSHDLAWSPSIGVAVMVVGLGLYLYGTKKD
jgi:hypothetical protein